MLDATLVARQVGVSERYEDSRVGAFSNLQQHLLVVAQGQTGKSFSTDLFDALTAAEVGKIAGYRSPAYLQMRKFKPPTGAGGVGSVPVTVALLPDAAGSTAATATIAVSGTATAAAAYTLKCSEIALPAFSIPKGAVNPNNVLRDIGNRITGHFFFPATYAYTYGTVVETHAGNTGDGVLGTFTTTGAPKPGTYSLVCTAAATDAGTFTMTDPDGEILSKTVTIGAQVVGGLGFTLADGTADFIVGDAFTITVPATQMTLTSTWKGSTANDLVLEMEGPTPGVGITFALGLFTGGTVDPVPTAALAQVGPTHITMISNALPVSAASTLDEYQTFGEARRDPTIKKPVLVFTGQATTTPQEAILIPDSRADDRINHIMGAPGCAELPCVQMAAALAEIVRLANNNPPHNYDLISLPSLAGGTPADQWDVNARDYAVKRGACTFELGSGGVVQISDVVSCYHPEGEDPPAYRYAVDQVKLMNIVNGADLIFRAPPWAGAPLVPDDQVVTNTTAKKPKDAVTALAAYADNLALAAIISDPGYSKRGITAVINASNAKRLDCAMPVKISGNTSIIDTVLKWSFYFPG